MGNCISQEVYMIMFASAVFYWYVIISLLIFSKFSILQPILFGSGTILLFRSKKGKELEVKETFYKVLFVIGIIVIIKILF